MNTERDKHIKNAKRMRRMEALFRQRSKIGKENFILTSHGKIRVLEYGFENKTIAPLYIDMHGGGFILMSADSDEKMNVFFHKQSGVKIVSIDYPKAPEYPYPIAVEAVYEIVLHYANNSINYCINANCIGIGGHSAGGNLATAIAIRAKERGDVDLKYQILDYPPLDLFTDSTLKPGPKKTLLSKMGLMFNACYRNPEDAKHPFVSPVFATNEQLQGLPPALIIVAGLDILHDEGVQYSQMLKNAGVKVDFYDFPNAGHGFTLKSTEDAKKAHRIMAEYIAANSQ